MLDINEIKKITSTSIKEYLTDCFFEGTRNISLLFAMTNEMTEYFYPIYTELCDPDCSFHDFDVQFAYVAVAYYYDDDKIVYELENDSMEFFEINDHLKCDYLDELVMTKCKELFSDYFN